MPTEFIYVGLLFLLFIVPKMLERFYIPAGLTAFFIGMILSLGFGLLNDSPTVSTLAILGISSLFLFAGLEVDLKEMKPHFFTIFQHITLQGLLMTATTFAVYKWMGLPFRASCIYALALVTPSTGFILNSMGSMNLKEDHRFTIKTNAIATEVLALFLMFITLQSASPINLIGASLGIVALVIVLPFIFLFFVKKVAPFAPDSEFTFFIMLAVVSGIITYKLGAYYLVGAFVVGVSAQRFKALFPELDIHDMIRSLKVFSAFFIPIYFFKAGSKVSLDDLSLKALLLGVVLLVLVTPIRVYSLVLLRKLTTQETSTERLKISLTMLPTLVFGLVLANILKIQYQIPSVYFGALLIYTILITCLPGIIVKKSLNDTPALKESASI